MKINERKAGVLLSYVLTATNALVGFIYIPLLIYFLGQDEYGLYQLMGSFLVYLGLFDFGLSNTVTRYYSRYIALKDKKGQENLLALSTIIYAILTSILIIVGITLYFFLEDIFANSLTSGELATAKKMYIVILITATITMSTSAFNSIITANEKFIFLRLLSIFQVVMRPIIVLAIFQLEASAINVVLVQAFIILFGVILKIGYSFRILRVKIKLHNFDVPLLKEMFRYSFFIFLTIVMDQIFWRSDQIILGILVGTAAVAVYSIGSQIITYYMTLSTAISGVFLPNITKRVTNNASNQELTSIFVRLGRIQYIMLSAVMIGFTLYGKEFITLWVGDNFSQSYYITLIIMFPFTIDLIQNIGLTILQAKNMYGFRAIVFSGMAIANILITIPLVIIYGLIGAALSTGVAYLIGNGIIMNIYYYKKVGLNVLIFWKNILKLSIPMLLVVIIGLFINKVSISVGIVSFLTKLLLFVISYACILWNFGMNNYEKNLILKPLGSIFRR